MSDHPSILEQLADIPEVEDGIWDICAHCRDIGEVSNEGLFFYPAIRYPLVISWNVKVKKDDGREAWFGGLFKRWKKDDSIVCLRFNAGRFNFDLYWDNNLSILPMGEKIHP